MSRFVKLVKFKLGSTQLGKRLHLILNLLPLTVSRWVWGLAIGVPVAAALAYILFGPDSEVAIVEMISLF